LKLLNPGHLIDGFEIEACLHAGGMAHIYQVDYAPSEDGTRRAAEFPMAMKIPRMTASDGAENIVSFEIELQILSELKGPHVPRFVAAGDLARVPYLVMEYVKGQTLQHIMDKSGALSVTEIATLGAAIARAVHSLHQQNVCHLDLKPANILIRPDGTAVLLDFGLSCHAHHPDLLAEELRKAVGSPVWISPEHGRGAWRSAQ
jgi:serine/threonine protein kinase